MVKNKSKNTQRGITLIALVITIIVLLILAGVAISMLSGDNGILKQAADAKTDTEQETVAEQVKLAAMAALTAGEGNFKSAKALETLNQELSKIKGYDATKNEKITGDFPAPVVIGDKTYIIEENGTTKEKSIVTDITAANYGDVITGYSINEVSDWKVFLNDGNNVWIMASDYVQVDSETLSKAGMTAISDYVPLGIIWETPPTKYTGDAVDQCVHALADTANWTNYVKADLAEKAMGGPTIEMLAKSYNGKYQEETGKSIVYKKDSENIGYMIGCKNNNAFEADVIYSTYVENVIKEGFYSISSMDKAGGYWLASKVTDGSGNTQLTRVGMGTIAGCGWQLPMLGVRPVVCLKSDLQVTSTTADGVTTWDIQK